MPFPNLRDLRATATPEAPRLRRVRQGRLLGGVAGGLAEHLGLPVVAVRVGLVLLCAVGGLGVALYAGLWLVAPQESPAGTTEGQARVPLDERATGLTVALLVAGVGVALLAGRPLLLPGPLLFPVLAVGVGVAVVWRQADDARRARWVASATGRSLPVTAVGVALVAVGLLGFLAARGELQQAREGLLSTGLAVGGIGLLAAPWISRTLAELRDERLQRVRSEERAEMSAMVHDSVLQTLALIQANAADPREVARLARAQERDLRGWLYRPAPGPALTLSAVLEQAAAEIEDIHGTPVEVVCVGDVVHEGAVVVLAAAAREAVVNGVKHSGATLVRVYAEVEPDRVTVFVRDRGKGFEPAAVPADRFGLAESVIGRLHRCGGTAQVRSAPGDGTEVTLSVPRG